jgi:hypothetical protein
MSIHILDDDSILNIFHFYRLAIFDEDEDCDLIRGGRGWDRELWWYKLAHVCQGWRNLLLGSPSYPTWNFALSVRKARQSQTCWNIPLPLVIGYSEIDRDITAEDDERIILALEQRDRASALKCHFEACRSSL